MKFSEFNIATSAGQIDYIVGYSGIQNYRISPSQFIGTYSTLNYIADSGNGTIDLGTQAFSILGTANEIETVGVAQTLTLRFPAAGVILPDGSRATTQPLGDNSTKVATTAYVNASITAEDLDFSGDTGTGSVDLDSQILNIIGTTNEIETAASGQTLTIGLPDDVSITGELTVLGIGQSSFTGQVTIPLNPVATTDAASKGYVDSQITAQDLDFTGDSGTGQVDLDSQALSITGGAVITTTALNQNLDIVHDNVSRTDTTSTDSPAFGGTFTSVDSVSSSSQGHITAINVKTVTLPTPSDATITLDAGTLLNGGGDFTLNQALNETITFNHDSVSRTDTTSTDAPAFGGTFTAVDSVTSSTEGHITAINLKTVTVPTPTYPTVNNNTITIDAGTNLNGGGDFTLNQNVDETITVNLDTTITGLTSVTSTTFAGQLNGSISSATTATTQAPNDNSTKVATTAYVDSSAGNYLPLAGGTMSGSIAMGGNNISGGGTATFTTFVGALQGNASTASALAASGNITLTGDTTSTGGPYTYTSGGNVAIATTIADTTVTGKVLTGVNLGTAQVISATDSILDAFGYLQAQITQLPQGLVYQGTWNASTNTPTLTSGTGTTGHFYIVSVAGSTNLDGITDWQVGDWAIFVESGGTDTWQKIDNTSAITGTGATNKLAKWTGPTTLSTGLVEDDGTTVTIGNSGDLDVTGSADITGDLAWGVSLTDTTNLISITKFVDEADGIPANDNDTSIPTSAAVKDYVDTQIGTVDTLAEVLAIGNTTGGTDIAVSAGDDITFTSTSKAIFNSSLEIYHDGSNSYIREGGIGDLLLRGNNLKLQTYGGADYLTASNGAQVELYYNNFKKLETTNTGISVTGNADISGEITVGTNDTVLQNDKLIFKSTSGAAIGHNTAATAIQFYTTTTTALDTLALTISGNNLTVSGELGVSGTGQSSFAGQVTIPLNPVANTDAASKGYVDSQIGLNDTLAEILANGNTTGGTDIAVSAGDNITFTNTSVAYFGSGNDLAIEHSGTLGQITNSTGDLYIQNGANNSDIIFRSDDGSGGLSNYIYLNGSAGTVSLYYYGSQKLYTATNGIQVTGNADISGQVQVGGANSLFAENNLRFNSAGAAYIDHNTTSQAINFRLSNASALDTTVMVLNSNGSTRLNQYGSGSFTGTATYRLAVDSSGDVIEIPIGDGAVDGSGAAGQVAFWTDTDTIDGENNLYWDSTNDRLGIGDATPSYALDVNGDVQINDLLIARSGSDLILQARASQVVGINSGGSRAMTLDASQRVGIGTSSPTATLELNSTTGNAAKLRVGRQTTATNYLELGTDGGSSVINAIGIPGVNAGLIFKRSTTTTTTESMHIDGNGRIYNYESLANGNTFYGWSAGNVSTTGQFNTSIGYNSGDNITGGSHNTLYGRDTGQAITTGYDNTAIGGQAGKEIVGGHSNTLIGRTSGQAITSGTENTFVGKGSGNVQTTASYNIFIGNNAGQFNTTGSYTVAIGREALRSQTTGGYSTAVGYQALYSTTTSNLNTGVGMQAGFYQTGTQNTFVGAYSGIGASGVSTGNNNTSLGYRALTSLRAGQQNTVLGTAAGYNLTDGSYNTLVGLDSGFNTTTGVSNAAFGRNTLVANTTGSYNTALGSDSLYNSTTASNNTALGYVALYNNTTGTENTALGRSALESSTTGSYNTAVGYQSLYSLGAGGDGNTAMGQQALQNNTASHNTAFGRHALIANTSGSANVAVGAFAGDSNTTGVYNTYIGYDAGQAANNNENVHIGFYAGRLSTGGENTIIGSQAVRLNNSSATNIVAIGRGAMYKLSSGNDNTAIGHQAGFEITTAINNTLVGKNSGDAITTGSSNTAVGQVAYSSNTTGTGNTAIGRASMQSGASGNYNTGVGNDTLEVATGSYNTAVGYRAGLAIQGANNNIAIGALSMFNGSVTGTQNVVVGTSGMYNLTTGNYNTGVGEGVMSVLTTGSYNTAMGREALDAQSTANSTTAIGYQSLTSANADGNTALGFQSGYGVTSGTYNVLIGHETGSLITTGSNNIAIGDRAGRLVGAASNNVHIGHQAGYESNEPVGQIAIGYRAGYDNAGDYSVYVGYEAGYNTGSGNDSVGVGYRALHTATSGVSNTAVGYGAGLNITTGNNNTALGTLALSNVTTGSLNLGIGRDAFGEVTVTSYNTGVGNSVGVYQTGNYNTSMGYHSNYGVSAASSGDYNATFGYYAGAYNRGENNTFLGALAGRFNSTGQRNTIVGSQAADNATITGSHNTALGFGAAHNITSGVHNVLIGDSSFFSGNANYTIAIGSDTLNTATGSDNVAIGYRAGYNVTSGSDNTLIGYQTGYSLTTGAPNTAVGRWALYSATTGFANTLMGYDCGASLTSGFQNVAMGQYAMRYSTTAGVNVAIGYEAMGIFTSTTSGARNVAVGYQAGAWITTGANNVLLGGNAGGSTSPAGQITTASNRVCLGDNNITHLYCATSTITTSDARDKTDVEDLTLGLDFIKELNPKTYRWDKRDWYEDGTPDGSKKAPKIESGLMAQEVLEAEKKFGYATEDNDMLFVDETEDKTKYGMKYERLVPVLINAIKELEKEIVNLKSQINK